MALRDFSKPTDKKLIPKELAMAKSKAVSVDIIPISENFKYVKYTYVYIHKEDAKRKITREKDAFKGYHPIGKPKFSSVQFPDGTGCFWYSEMMYEKD